MKRLVTLLCLAALLLPMASCNKSNEQKVKEPVIPPAYSQYAKKYNVQNNPEGIVGLELTEAGRYLITRKVEVKSFPSEEYEFINGSTFEYEIVGQQLGNDIFNSQAKGKAEPKSDGTLWLEISANVNSESKEYKGTVTLILSQYKGA